MKKCVICDVEIPKRSGRGRQKKTCSDPCRLKHKDVLFNKAKASFAKCSIDGCHKAANRTGFGLCETHYYRNRRNGTTELKGIGNPEDTEHTGGYMLRRAKDHPLSAGRSREYVHRLVYFDAYGEGPFKCKWCGKQVTWSDLHIDHLDEDKKNNDLSNLAASCCRCNTGRSMEDKKHRIALKQGIEFNGEVRTINSWAEKIGISRPALMWRLKRGWSMEKALSPEKTKRGPNRVK